MHNCTSPVEAPANQQPFCHKSCRNIWLMLAAVTRVRVFLIFIPFFSCVYVNFLAESDRDFIKDHKQSKHLLLCVWFLGFFCAQLPTWSILGRDGGSGSWRPSCSAGEASASMAKKSRTGMWWNEPSVPYVHTPLSVPAAPEMQLSFPTTAAGCSSVPLC